MTREQRSKAKTANFGIIYGISVFGLAERLNVDRKEAKALIDGYFENYPNVKAYMDQSIQEAREKGYIETIFKRKRYLRTSTPKMQSSEGMPNEMQSMPPFRAVPPILLR